MCLSALYSIFKKDFIYLCLCQVFVALRGLSLVAAGGGFSYCRAPASLSCIAAPQHVEPFHTRDRTHVPCLGRRILIHYATRKVYILFYWSICSSLCLHHIVLVSCSLLQDSTELWNQVVYILQLFFFKIILAILGPLHFYIPFRISLSISTWRMLAGILTGVELTL